MMNVMFVLFAERAFSDVLEDENSKFFSSLRSRVQTLFSFSYLNFACI